MMVTRKQLEGQLFYDILIWHSLDPFIWQAVFLVANKLYELFMQDCLHYLCVIYIPPTPLHVLSPPPKKTREDHSRVPLHPFLFLLF